MAVTYQLIRPTSETDANYEAYEFVLGWYGRNGNYYTYMFTDWEGNDAPRVSNLNITNKTKLSNIINEEEREIEVTAEDLSLNDMHILSSIFVSKKIVRVYKDGTTERLGLGSNSKRWRQTDGRYNLRINLIRHELPLAQ